MCKRNLFIIGAIYVSLLHTTFNRIDALNNRFDNVGLEAETEKELIKIIEPETAVENEIEKMVLETKKIEDIEIVKAEFETETESMFYLSEEERRIAECIVMGESGAEPYKGQLLVAQCLLNACLKDGLQPSEVRKVYKYSGWNSNPSESVKNAVSEVFDNGYKVTDEYVLYFYAPKLCNSKWHETQKFVTEVGGHRFFAER